GCIMAFFFSSRRRHTRWPRDWSSDVCSSDLVAAAAPAERLVVDVRTVMPAALAFAVQARRDLHPQLAARAMHAGGGGEHHELEVLAEVAEQLVVAAAGVEIDLGLQRRADLAGRAQLLDFLAHGVAQLAQ